MTLGNIIAFTKGRNKMRILIVDDDFAIRKVLSVWLSSIGECQVAANGNEGMNIFEKSFEIGENFDLIFMDVMMPGKNGLETLKEIRAFEADKKIDQETRTKVVMLTAAANPRSIMGAHQHNCEAYLIKPVEKEDLFKEIKKLFPEE
jgi:two-component system chemotaxis response regulator CheY